MSKTPRYQSLDMFSSKEPWQGGLQSREEGSLCEKKSSVFLPFETKFDFPSQNFCVEPVPFVHL
jgi:hypothetical protein